MPGPAVKELAAPDGFGFLLEMPPFEVHAGFSHALPEFRSLGEGKRTMFRHKNLLFLSLSWGNPTIAFIDLELSLSLNYAVSGWAPS